MPQGPLEQQGRSAAVVNVVAGLPRAGCGDGARSYRYIRTGTNHYSLAAFTYDWIASEHERGPVFTWHADEIHPEDRPIMWHVIQAMRNEGVEWPPRWNREF